jgi:hypothetical protein
MWYLLSSSKCCRKLKNGGMIMRTVLIGLLMAGLALAVSGTVVLDHPGTIPFSPSYMTDGELSRDNGNIASAWVYINGANTYAGEQYDTPADLHYLTGIKYNVWSQGWPDSTYQGMAVACWKMTGGTPGDVVWPTDGQPIYNPNTGGNWITQTVTGGLDLAVAAPTGFIVGIGFLYSYPANDAYGVDNTGVGPYDWAEASGAWQAAPYGKGSGRALITDSVPGVETTTMGTIRALYR